MDMLARPAARCHLERGTGTFNV